MKDNNLNSNNNLKSSSMKSNNIKDSYIKDFFAQHKQKIEDNGFSERLFAQLECLPKPVSTAVASAQVLNRVEVFKGFYLSVNSIITLLFTFVGIALFFSFGGYSVVIESLVSIGDAIVDFSLVTPQIVISILFLIFSLFFLGKFAIEVE